MNAVKIFSTTMMITFVACSAAYADDDILGHFWGGKETKKEEKKTEDKGNVWGSGSEEKKSEDKGNVWGSGREEKKEDKGNVWGNGKEE